jgi:hypothetical protein
MSTSPEILDFLIITSPEILDFDFGVITKLLAGSFHGLGFTDVVGFKAIE